MDKKETKDSKITAEADVVSIAETTSAAEAEATTVAEAEAITAEASVDSIKIEKSKTPDDAAAESSYQSSIDSVVTEQAQSVSIASAESNSKDSEPVGEQKPDPGKKSKKGTGGKPRNPFGGREKGGERMDRRVRDGSNSYKALKIPPMKTKFPLSLSVLSDFGASVSLQYLPSYDEDIAFLYQHVQFGMFPYKDGLQRVDDLSLLVSRHFEYVFSLDSIRQRIANLKERLEKNEVDVDRLYRENTRSIEIEVSSPHVLSFFEAIKLADEITTLNNMAWISGLVDKREAGAEQFALVRLIEKEFNFINRIAQICRDRKKWNPFPYFEPVRNRMAKEAAKEAAKKKEQTDMAEEKDSKPVVDNASPSKDIQQTDESFEESGAGLEIFS